MGKNKSTKNSFEKSTDILSKIFNQLPIKCFGQCMLVQKSTRSTFPNSADILSEIFNRLQIKSLGKCMLVQKSWYTYIKSPDFIKLHLNHQKSYSLYLIFSAASKGPFSARYDYRQCEEYYKLQFPSGCGTWYRMSNGVVCLSRLALQPDSKIYLWNPIIQKIKTLPDSPLNMACEYIASYCRVNLGFGYFKELDDFQVVKILMCPERLIEWSVIVDVYSLGSNSWETVRFNDDDLFRYELRNNSVFVNSSAYWLGKKQSDREAVFRFNLKNKNISEIKLPEECSSGKIYIQAYGESLSLFDFNCKSGMLELWILTKTGNEYVVWNRKMSINLQGVNQWLPLGFRNNGEIILRKKNASGLVSYNNDNREVREFADLNKLRPSKGIDIYEKLHVPPFSAFVESLVLLGDASLGLLGDADASDILEKPRKKAKVIFKESCFACYS